MKKLISIDDLKAGMFLEADVVDEMVDSQTVSFLDAKHAVSTAPRGSPRSL